MSHAVVHFEVAGRDLEKLQRFYSDLFGWKTQGGDLIPDPLGVTPIRRVFEHGGDSLAYSAR